MPAYCDFERDHGTLVCTLCGRRIADQKLAKPIPCTANPDWDYELCLADATPCTHRGDRIGKAGCFGCGQARIVGVYACGIHEKCTVIKTPKYELCPCPRQN